MSKNEPQKKFRTPYGVHKRISFATIGESRTHQSFKDECDINNVVRNHATNGGIFTHTNPKMSTGSFISDLPSSSDYKESLDSIIQATDSFNALPSLLRARFNNDPYEFLEFASDGANITEMAQLGLLTDESAQRAFHRSSKVDSSSEPKGSESTLTPKKSKTSSDGQKKASSDD